MRTSSATWSNFASCAVSFRDASPRGLGLRGDLAFLFLQVRQHRSQGQLAAAHAPRQVGEGGMGGADAPGIGARSAGCASAGPPRPCRSIRALRCSTGCGEAAR